MLSQSAGNLKVSDLKCGIAVQITIILKKVEGHLLLRILINLIIMIYLRFIPLFADISTHFDIITTLEINKKSYIMYALDFKYV